ncbi:FtsW/RodA/SpoVE family cell cycle protein [Bacillus sp. BHET2]|uniref:FtsW/RodA/SpoVE family cell cycle protein n=1 Tax=Bacillus sp. BHET2 TaxID=2583818 RepID=UPI00110E168C|nr:FtsW/RodA/SpoVE family cell cycle protein [Bacillus sp. BHET2]TMU85067.1 FtsW/RodA/SpoVE family cell cycle protein [Bacillus sp. BHET2]
MTEKRNEYMDKVLGYVRNKEAKRFVEEELHYHLDQESINLKDSGLDEQVAEDQAIHLMGSAERLGLEMNKLHRPRVDWTMIGLVLVISMIGILPTLHISEELYNDNGFLVRKIVFLMIGAVISLSLMFFDYRKLHILKWWIYGFTALVLISLTFFPNTTVNGAAYFRMESFTIDSTATVTLLVLSWIIFLGTTKTNFWVVTLLFIGSLYPLMIIPSLPAVFVFTLTITVLLWLVYKNKRKHIILGYTGSALIIAIMMINLNIKPYQFERIFALIHPEEYKSTTGYMYLRNHDLLARGGWIGEAGGNEVITEPHTNFAFTTITYHYGWIVGGVLIITGLFIMYRMIRNIQSIKDPFGRVIIIGGVTLFSTQFLYNIGMILGFLPLTGMSLPFVSYGLNPTLQTSLVIGLFLSVYRRKNLVSVQAFENVQSKN